MVTVAGEGAVAGAVYRPELDTAPTVALPPAAPLTDQVTLVLEEPVTVAENCCVFPACTEADVGATETEMVAPPAVMVTGTTATLLESTLLTAKIFTLAGEGTAAGAVYRPELEMVPNVELPPVIAFTSQVTAVFDVPVTVEVNCCVCPVCTEADEGEIEIAIPAEPVMVTAADAILLESAALTAAMVTVAGDGAVDGAVYTPEPEIVPTVEFPPVTPFTDQATAVLDVPVTEAVNCCVCPVCTEADAGETDTETVALPPVMATGTTATLLESTLQRKHSRWQATAPNDRGIQTGTRNRSHGRAAARNGIHQPGHGSV